MQEFKAVFDRTDISVQLNKSRKSLVLIRVEESSFSLKLHVSLDSFTAVPTLMVPGHTASRAQTCRTSSV